MKLTFAGQVIALGWDFYGFDSVTGFNPRASQLVQWAQLLRADFAVPYARGNRKVTLKGRIIPAPAPTVEERMIELEAFFMGLAGSGALVKQVGNSTVTYAGAVLQSYETVEDFAGVSYAFDLTFVAGASAIVDQSHAITDQTGGVITDQTGAAISDS